MPNFGKRTPFARRHLTPFEACYGDKADGSGERREGEWSFMTKDGRYADNAGAIVGMVGDDAGKAVDEQNEGNSRWRCFSRELIREEKGDSLDISWIKDQDSIDAADLPAPEILAAEAMGELTEALRELDSLMRALGSGEQAEVRVDEEGDTTKSNTSRRVDKRSASTNGA